jgi:hypothetical protein
MMPCYEPVARDRMLARNRLYCYQGIKRRGRWSIVISINVLRINHNVPPP